MLCCFCTHMITDTMKDGQGYCNVSECYYPYSHEICSLFEDIRPIRTDCTTPYSQSDK